MTIDEKISKLIKNLEELMYSDYHIHAGIEREVVTKRQEKNGEDRTYFVIRCYTLNRNYKGQYKCGYIVMQTGEYRTEKWDEVNAETKEYIG